MCTLCAIKIKVVEIQRVVTPQCPAAYAQKEDSIPCPEATVMVLLRMHHMLLWPRRALLGTKTM